MDPVDTVIYYPPSTSNQVSMNNKRVLFIYFSMRQKENWCLENLIVVFVCLFEPLLFNYQSNFKIHCHWLPVLLLKIVALIYLNGLILALQKKVKC